MKDPVLMTKSFFHFFIPLYANKGRGKWTFPRRRGTHTLGRGWEKGKAVKISKNIIVKHLIIKSLKFHGFFSSHNDNTMMMRKARSEIMTL